MQRQIPLQKRSQTRVEQIIQSAETLFSMNGIDAVSPSDIAEQAQLTRTSLYRYFPNKTAIIHSLAMQQLDSLEKLFDEITTTLTSMETFLETLCSRYEQFIKARPAYLIVWSATETSPLLQVIKTRGAELWMKLWSHQLDQSHLSDISSEQALVISLLPQILTKALSAPDQETEGKTPTARIKSTQRIIQQLLTYYFPSTQTTKHANLASPVSTPYKEPTPLQVEEGIA